MTSRSASIFVGALIAVSLFGGTVRAQEPGTDHGHHAADELVLISNDGEKWASDESLRQGMDSIRQAFRSRVPGFREKTLGAAQYEALADDVEAQLAFMFNNCDLPPDADAELHKLLAFIAGAASDLRSDGERRNGMISLHRALDAYPEFFDHPGWAG